MRKTPSVKDPEQYFRTDRLKADLKGRSVRGGAVTMVAQGCKFILQMSSTIVLARLLAPQDYGLVGMVTAVTGFIGLFKDMGLSMATVQRAEINHRQVSTLSLTCHSK
ncbi:MAG TPA: lipopolysaccharide biosynthesis protein, partial [Cyanobacteria bacterium UBA11049]|nr:lipopolysaccharide biosynthesis protein [Cyanobacteria bacterium UBA11049]